MKFIKTDDVDGGRKGIYINPYNFFEFTNSGIFRSGSRENSEGSKREYGGYSPENWLESHALFSENLITPIKKVKTGFEFCERFDCNFNVATAKVKIKHIFIIYFLLKQNKGHYLYHLSTLQQILSKYLLQLNNLPTFVINRHRLT